MAGRDVKLFRVPVGLGIQELISSFQLGKCLTRVENEKYIFSEKVSSEMSSRGQL